MRVLFVNHTGVRGGAENAMLRLLESLPPESSRLVACPPEGGLKAALQERGIAQVDLPGTDLSFTLGPLQTPSGLARVLGSAITVARTARRSQADVIHANTVRAGLIAVAARLLGGPPVVVQCHDHLPRTRLGRLTRLVIARGAAAVVAVSKRTAAEFDQGLRAPKAECVYISVDQQRFTPTRASGDIRSELSLPPGAPLLAEVAQITPWKGQDTAIRALALMRAHLDAHLLIVGEVAFSSHRYDNEGFRQSLDALATELGVESAVHFVGRRSDVPEVIREIDLLLLPSWDEPFGLVVAEAMSMGTPVVVTNRGGVTEYVEDGVSGRVVPPGDSEAWASAVEELLGQPDSLARMGRESVRIAALFSDERYSQEMLAVYERVANA